MVQLIQSNFIHSIVLDLAIYFYSGLSRLAKFIFAIYRIFTDVHLMKKNFR